MTPKSLPKGRFHEIWQAGRYVFRAAAGRNMAGRALTVFPDDIFLVSYPRSGNTWTRFLIGNLLKPDDPVSFANIETCIPEIYFNPDRILRSLPRPRLLKSHECFQPLYKRVIYITRDPRDVAVSFYHHHVKAGNLSDDFPIDEFVPRFVAGEFDPAFGSWGENVQSWLAVRDGSRNFLWLQYEQMLRSPESALEKIAEFLLANLWPQMDTAPDRIRRAVELSSLDRMRTLERQQSKQWVLTRSTRQDKPFVRAAKTGQWRDALSANAVNCIESAWGGLMRRLGYTLSSASASISEVHDRETTLNS
jgi:Sulfotransferase domain